MLVFLIWTDFHGRVENLAGTLSRTWARLVEQPSQSNEQGMSMLLSWISSDLELLE